ncbi:MAG: cob(I)yrinic acid a,c-diamide adenosyltransferase [Thermovirgaceae bacterium]
MLSPKGLKPGRKRRIFVFGHTRSKFMALFEKGLVHVYTGNGKGKTTAALGITLRVTGHGGRVAFIQFMKGWPHYGETAGLASLEGVEHFVTGRPDFVDRAHPDPVDVFEARRGFKRAAAVLEAGKHDLVVLDEVIVAIDYGMLSAFQTIEALAARAPHVEVILTGRGAPPELIECADYVTEMMERKHPFRKGVPGRMGAEY